MNKIYIFSVTFFLSLSLYGHKGEKHVGSKKNAQPIEVSRLKKINQKYIKNVRSIFKKKCFDCHSNTKKLPWYSELPIVGQIVKGDRKEGLKHLDLTNDFPFAGHGNPKEDLEAIQHSIKKGDMPPLRYKVFHWDSRISEQEKKVLEQWIKKSLKPLK